MLEMPNWDLFLIAWWPHSGCRWLNRSLLARNPDVATSEYVLPFLTHSTDMILRLDRTAQVLKARSLPNLAEEFGILRQSVEAGRHRGTEVYFQEKKRVADRKFPNRKHGGVLSLGVPEPLFPDLEMLFAIVPGVRIVHLVRHPHGCFLSMKARGEMDGNPYKIGSSWRGINALVREYCLPLGDTKYFLLRYEDLVSDTRGELVQLCAWIGVPFVEIMLDGVNEYHGRNKDIDLAKFEDPKERDILMTVVKEEAWHYGYED